MKPNVSSHFPSILLASQSPRRRQLLDSLGLPFSVAEPSGEEAHPDIASLEEITQKNALMKAKSVASQLAHPNDISLGADTLVALDEDVLGKPADRTEAVSMLLRLSGRIHEVRTGMALVSPIFGERTICVRSFVQFRMLTQIEIERYADCREPYDKAGSYAVQGLGALFIQRIEGSYSNVMGLPIEALLSELSSFTGIRVEEFFPKQ